MKADSKNNSTDTLHQTGGGGEGDAGASSSKDADLTVNDGNAALEEVEAQEKMTATTEKIRATKFDLDKQMTSHLGKLDSLIDKAERAEVSMQKQNQQMKGMLR